jgi:hypothetical protein
MKVNPERYMGTAEIAERLGVDRVRARSITRRNDFPAPYAQITLGRIWLSPDIAAWIRTHPGVR